MTADDLVTRARRHAATHPESRDLIGELLAEIEAADEVSRRITRWIKKEVQR